MATSKSQRPAELIEKILHEEEEAANVFGAVAADKVKEENSVDGAMASDDSNSALEMVKPEYLIEEEELKKLNEEKARREESAEADEYKELTHEERYERLMELLGRSQFYSNYMLQKLQAEDEESKQLKEQKLKDRKSISKPKTANKTEPKRASRKRKLDEDEDESGGVGGVRKGVGRMFNNEPIPEQQPILLTGGVMRDYQIRGYQWMATLFENGINGILADEMGLGKTIQTIALFCHLVEMDISGPFLIVAPLSTITNWVKEFNRFAPEIPVVLYHGTQLVRQQLRKKLGSLTTLTTQFETARKVRPVFITSFEIAMNDRPFFRNVRWRYLVVDEGHRLKNKNCRLIKELKFYNAANKLLLTGTPLQNNLDELWSLLNFLMGEIFDDLRVFKSWFDPKSIDVFADNEQDRIIKQEQQDNILSTLHQILTPFLLRRVKADVDLKIPPKKELLVYCPMTKKQTEMYEAIVNHTIHDFLMKDEDMMEGGSNLNVNVDSNARKPRRVARVDYTEIFKLENLESTKNFEKYSKAVAQLQEERDQRMSSLSTTNGKEFDMAHRTNDLCYSLKSRMMDLRKCTNHPYLLEYPLTEDGNFYRVDEDLIEICGKTKVLDQLLTALLQRQHKVLIFSQMTRLLDIIEDFCGHRSYKYSRLDGSMAYEDRQRNIDKFNESDEVRIFLLSTRAGGLGINLTAADTCIIYDSDWNPQQDLQAQDRCHRIGQTKPVMIYRLVTANTIDAKIVERAAAKRKLEKMIIHSKKFKSQDLDGLKKTMEALSPQELLDLLKSQDHHGVVNRQDGPVFTTEELDMLLDRSGLSWEKLAAKKEELKENNFTPPPAKRGRPSSASKSATKLAAKASPAAAKAKPTATFFQVIDASDNESGLASIQNLEP